jgi:malic enzyme
VLSFGAGQAGIGIARLLRAAQREAGADEPAARRRHLLIDRAGLLTEASAAHDERKRPFALDRLDLAYLSMRDVRPEDHLEIVRRYEPTVLIGTSGVPGLFGERLVREMAAHVERPIVMPLSSPARMAECTLAEALRWTDGRAILATGNAFAPVEYRGQIHVVGQANNAFVFPGIALGCLVSEARELSDEIFLAAAHALAACVDEERLCQGAVFPDVGRLREVNLRVACAVARTARDQKVGRLIADEDIEPLVRSHMWFPEYGSWTEAPSPRG